MKIIRNLLRIWSFNSKLRTIRILSASRKLLINSKLLICFAFAVMNLHPNSITSCSTLVHPAFHQRCRASQVTQLNYASDSRANINTLIMTYSRLLHVAVYITYVFKFERASKNGKSSGFLDGPFEAAGKHFCRRDERPAPL